MSNEIRDRILLYRGVGNSKNVLVRGHYFKKYPIKVLMENHGQIQNFKQALRRFRLQPHNKRRLEVRIGISKIDVFTDSDGYFEIILPNPQAGNGWHEFKVKDPLTPNEFDGTYIVPDETSPSIISDIDDTVMISHSTKFFKKMRLILFKNAHSRKITKSLKIDNWMSNLLSDDEADSYFYVSSSEWNLYDFLKDFFEIKQLPKGPFFLNRLKTHPMDLFRSGNGSHNHKLESIRFLFEFYPGKKFYLIGDSGQQDVQIYMDAARENPERVGGVLIRKIKINSRKQILENASKFFAERNIPFHAFTDKELSQINTDN